MTTRADIVLHVRHGAEQSAAQRRRGWGGACTVTGAHTMLKIDAVIALPSLSTRLCTRRKIRDESGCPPGKACPSFEFLPAIVRQPEAGRVPTGDRHHGHHNGTGDE